jgi:biopolymer transport protein ExbD
MKKSIGMAIAVAILAVAARFQSSQTSVSGQTASVQAEGALTVNVPISYRQDRRVALGTEPLSVGTLRERVRQRLETSAQKKVILNCDRDITVGEAVELMNFLKAAGAEQVALTSN